MASSTPREPLITDDELIKRMKIAASAARSPVRDIQMPDRGKLSMEDVRILREAGLHELADIAEKYVLRDQMPWWRRWLS